MNNENNLIVVEEKLQQENVQGTTQELTISMPKTVANPQDIWSDVDAFERVQRFAGLLANSDIVPQGYKGNIANCVIAIDIANRLGTSPLTIMQSSQVVKGNFTWKGQACKAMIDSCGKYVHPTVYIEVGERDKDTWGYYLEAEDKQGRIIKGVLVDIAMAKKEGWYAKDGSKWKTMPELMLKYRAAAFFMRTECAEIAMGFLTSEEVEDIPQTEDNKAKSLSQRLKGEF